MLHKKTLLSTALVAGLGFLAFAASPAHAASTGTINFTGKVLADTCTISINGGPGTTVALPTVMTGAFGSVGATAGTTSFTVGVSGCDANTTSAAMAFNGANIDGTTGNLKNTTATGGSNVQIQLLNSSNAVINTSSQANAPTIAVSGGSGSTGMKAQYIATAASTTAGLVTSSVGFTLTYQ